MTKPGSLAMPNQLSYTEITQNNGRGHILAIVLRDGVEKKIKLEHNTLYCMTIPTPAQDNIMYSTLQVQSKSYITILVSSDHHHGSQSVPISGSHHLTVAN